MSLRQFLSHRVSSQARLYTYSVLLLQGRIVRIEEDSKYSAIKEQCRKRNAKRGEYSRPTSLASIIIFSNGASVYYEPL